MPGSNATMSFMPKMLPNTSMPLVLNLDVKGVSEFRPSGVHPRVFVRRQGWLGRTAARLAVTWVVIGASTWCSAAITVADPGTFVVDRAGALTPQALTAIEQRLRSLQERTTAQVKLLTVPDTDGEDVFAFGHRHAEAWKLGQQGKDNGALIVFVPKSKKQKGEIRIHTGYGLEAALPDSWCGTIQRQIVESFFRRNQYSEGLDRLTAEVANKILGEGEETQLAPPVGTTRRNSGRAKGSRGNVICASIVPLVIILIVVSSLAGRRRGMRRWGGGDLAQQMMWAAMINSMFGGGRSHWGGGRGRGGGFGGGGFFGGGGRFGGGGAGASW